MEVVRRWRGWRWEERREGGGLRRDEGLRKGGGCGGVGGVCGGWGGGKGMERGVKGWGWW